MNWGQALCRISPAQEHKAGMVWEGQVGLWDMLALVGCGEEINKNPVNLEMWSDVSEWVPALSWTYRWHQKLLFLNLSFAESEHIQGLRPSILQEMLRSLRKSCYVSTRILPPLNEEEDALLHPLGLGTHGGGKSEFRMCQMRQDLLHTMKQSITGV